MQGLILGQTEYECKHEIFFIKLFHLNLNLLINRMEQQQSQFNNLFRLQHICKKVELTYI